MKILASVGAIALVSAGIAIGLSPSGETTHPTAAVASSAWLSSATRAPSASAEAPAEPSEAASERNGSESSPAPSAISPEKSGKDATGVERSEAGQSHARKVAPISPPSEASLIGRAHRQLQDNPGEALALTKTHRKLYPSGVLAPEREVIAIEALSRLGKSQAAEKRAQSYRAEQPHSIHELRLRKALGDAGTESQP